MHSARWKYDVDFNDKDVVVLGAGSTASQVVPALIEKPQNARSVTQIMRSPPWVAPKRVPPGGHEGFAKWSPSVLGSVPWMATLLRYVVFHQMETEFDMMFKTGDPDKVAKNRAVAQTRYLGFMKRVVPAKYHEILTPRYTLMCKRRVFDAGWFRSLNDDRINLELGEIADMGESSLTVGLYDPKRTSDNTSYHHNKTLRTETEANGTAAKTNSRNAVVAKKEVPCDVLVLANGYEMGTWIHPIRVYGRGGASIHDTWESRGGPQMYLGTAIDGFPNFFMIFGPNTASGHSSVIVGAESSVEHALKFIRKIFVTKEVETFEVKEKPCRDYVREIHRLLKMTAFSESGLTGCGSSYIKDGWNSTVYPRSQTDFALRCRFPNMNHWNATYTTKGRIWNILRQTVFSGGISAVAFWFYLARYGGETWRTGFNTVFRTVLDRVRHVIA
jgi:cation diffusion facilitator CzcD-associated flavoprotein CzcO